MNHTTQPYSMHRDATGSSSHRTTHTEPGSSPMRDATAVSSSSSSSHPTPGSASCGCEGAGGGQANWMAVTIIEDDDLMFGGKPLCTWYEEDRRCRMAEDSEASPCSSMDGDDEELHRGRQRDRLQDQRTSHTHTQQLRKKKHDKGQH